MEQNNFSEHNILNLLKILKLIYRNIWIIGPFVVLSMVGAYFFNRFSIPSYYVSSSLLIMEDSKKQKYSDQNSNFINYDLFSSTQNLQNELMILKSYPIIEKTIKNLDLDVSYFEYKDFQYYSAYGSAPFKVLIYKDHPQLVGAFIDIQFNTDGSFVIKSKKQDVAVYRYDTYQYVDEKKDLELNLKGNVGKILETDALKLLITLNDDSLSLNDGRNYAFKLETTWELTNLFKYGLEFNLPNKLATVIEIGIKTSSVKLSKDVINELMRVYIASKLEDKNHLANVTIDYIDKQLEEVSTSLNATGDNLKNFKASNRAIDVDQQASRLSQQQLDLQNQLAALTVQKKYYDYLKEYNSNNSDYGQIVAPASMGVTDPLLNKLIEELSTAQAQLDHLIKNNQERNPMVNRLNIQIKNLKSTISENINSASRTNDLAISEMQGRIGQLDSKISKLPETQMQLGGIERKYMLNDAIYNYLLEKQAEAKITKASNLSDNIIIEPAHVVGGVVWPKKNFNYMIAFMLGFGFPFGIIFLKMFFKSTITEQEDIENISNVIILGKVFHYNNIKEKNVFLSNPNHKTAETFRTLRTNLNFALNGKSNKTILVSSCVSGEGKTFSALNIAAAFAQVGKKTILLNFDLRNSNSVINGTDNSKGISLYLSGEIPLEDVILKSELKNLEFINSGPVPPNPLELMENDITANLFEYLKRKYDYIIIDSTPMAQVSDAFSVIRYADLNLIVTRYNVTKKKLLRLVLGELKNKNVNNVYVILNDNKLVSEQMGYGYYNK